ncbi:MAG: hypothetical protein ABW086_11410 [Sedimenticola sp.]
MNLAREADKNRNIREAINLYEELVASGEADLTDILNLVVIYFNCMDLGYASAHSVGTDIETVASSRALDLITCAEKQYGSNDELLYWKSMIPFHGWSEPVPKWKLQGDSDVPFLYLARENPNVINVQHVRALAEGMSDIDESERKRYLVGKIELVLNS